MKNFVFLFISGLLISSSCEQLQFDEISKTKVLLSSTSQTLQVPRFFVEPVICNIDDCHIDPQSKNRLEQCIQCLRNEDYEFQAVYYFLSFREKGCEDPLFTCHPPMPLEEFTIAVEHSEEENVSGEITTVDGEVFARTSRGTIAYEGGKAYLQFKVVNPELSREFLKFKVNTNIRDERKGILPILITGNLGEAPFEE